MAKGIVSKDLFIFVPMLGTCSKNVVFCSDGQLLNTSCASDCLILLGDEDLYLTIDLTNCDITGLCGNIKDRNIGIEKIDGVFAFDGAIHLEAGFKIFPAKYICYDGTTISYDPSVLRLQFGNRDASDIFIRVAENLIIGLEGNKIGCILAENIRID